MEYLIKLLLSNFCIQSLFRGSFIEGNSICGNESTKISCHQMCYDGCMQRVGTEDMTKEEVKESIATQTNLCVNKCYGNEYLPLLYKDVPELPQYSDVLNCLGRCAYPVHTKYCLEGYISGFFYCDCHHCCVQTPNNRKCIRGCHLWFMRQWSWKAYEGCRYRVEIRNSPKTWCTDFCTFVMLQRDPSLTWDDIPSVIKGIAAPCITRCTKLILAGIPVDYDVRLEPCREITKCISVAITNFKVFTTYNMTNALIESHMNSSIQLRDPKSYFTMEENYGPTVFHQGDISFIKDVLNKFDVRRSPALDNMHSSGIKITLENDPGNPLKVSYPPNMIPDFPWNNSGPVLAKAYSYRSDPGKIGVKYRHFYYDIGYDIEPCTKYREEAILLAVEGIRFEHEISLKIADTTSLFPLTALEIKNEFSKRSNWWSGLEYVKDLDDHTIEMKAKGHAFARFGMRVVVPGYDPGYNRSPNACELIQGCDYPRPTNVNDFCHVRVNNRSFVESDFGCEYNEGSELCRTYWSNFTLG